MELLINGAVIMMLFLFFGILSSEATSYKPNTGRKGLFHYWRQILGPGKIS